jgi:hypothetical protein
VTFVHVDCADVAVLTLLGSGVVETVRVFVVVRVGLDGRLGAGLDAMGVLGGGKVETIGVGVGVGIAAEVAVTLGGAGAAEDVHPAISAPAASRAATSRYAGRWSTAGCSP